MPARIEPRRDEQHRGENHHAYDRSGNQRRRPKRPRAVDFDVKLQIATQPAYHGVPGEFAEGSRAIRSAQGWSRATGETRDIRFMTT